MLPQQKVLPAEILTQAPETLQPCQLLCFAWQLIKSIGNFCKAANWTRETYVELTLKVSKCSSKCIAGVPMCSPAIFNTVQSLWPAVHREYFQINKKMGVIPNILKIISVLFSKDHANGICLVGFFFFQYPSVYFWNGF